MKSLALLSAILFQNILFAENGDSLLPKRMLGFNITTALIPRLEKSTYLKNLKEPINLAYGINLDFSTLIIKRKHVYFDAKIGYQFGNQKFSYTSTNYLTKQDYRDLQSPIWIDAFNQIKKTNMVINFILSIHIILFQQ